MRQFAVKKEEKLAKFITKEYEGIPYFTARKLIRTGEIKVNGKRVKEDVVLSVGDVVSVYYELRENNDFDIIYEDENVLVANKPQKLTSDDFYRRLSENRELYYIHRLDRNTGGIMIFAKNPVAEAELLAGFKNRTFDKYYLAEVYGRPKKTEDILTAYLVKDEKASAVKVFDKKVSGGVEIKTGYKLIEEREKTSLLEVKLFTGKTHQIRAHLAHEGNFIVGDGKYGDEKINRELKVKTQRLFAKKLVLHFDKSSPLSYLDKREFILERNY